MPDYLPHTDDDIEAMLGFLGLGSLEELFSVVPPALRLVGGLELDDGRSEPDVVHHFQTLARGNRARVDQVVCFAGGGAYDHELPAVTAALAGRSEFVTSYTPYQPEVAQGVLQAMFEYQSLVARLTGLPIANASLYDGASALVEAVNLGVAASGRSAVWVSSGIHPHWRAVLRTCAAGTGHRLVEIELDQGRTRWPAEVGGDPGAPGVVVVGYPNYLGCLEDLDEARALCDRHGALLVVAQDPVAAGILRAPGHAGADVVVGEGQPLGTALSFGGPYLGLFACRQEHIRRLPGRLVGATVDTAGRRAYVTTLRAREQDIRREKATSNICTNQTLMAVTAAIQLGWLGPRGLEEVALRSAQGLAYLRSALLAVPGVEPITGGTPVVREMAIRTATPAVLVLERLLDEGFLGGIALSALVSAGDPSISPDDAEHGVLVAVTERRTRAEIDALVDAVGKVTR